MFIAKKPASSWMPPSSVAGREIAKHRLPPCIGFLPFGISPCSFCSLFSIEIFSPVEMQSTHTGNVEFFPDHSILIQKISFVRKAASVHALAPQSLTALLASVRRILVHIYLSVKAN
jgi:hypothetical protein